MTVRSDLPDASRAASCDQATDLGFSAWAAIGILLPPVCRVTLSVVSSEFCITVAGLEAFGVVAAGLIVGPPADGSRMTPESHCAVARYSSASLGLPGLLGLANGTLHRRSEQLEGYFLLCD